MTFGIVKRTEDDLTQRLATESVFISGLRQRSGKGLAGLTIEDCP
ncbi:hypothetical protein A176_005127 [Myxococcus hansupus]|uniref:Uncharacterized protein n=1 Tax=Pseudomyxococcus hansupus TaxID=1297742 RepID=A0A0H4X3J4_9BACT|nr:hypothetical protein [Myxococcus hansupus]AKQ68215.1 hypothetical protein A176_005127 [Myxococcus hansupus]